MARHNAHGEQREQGDPVLGVCNGPRADRREKEEIEAEKCHQRGCDRDRPCRHSRDTKYDEEEGERNDRGIRHTEPDDVDHRYETDGAKAGG